MLHAFALDLRSEAGREACPPPSPSLRRAVYYDLRNKRTETGAALEVLVDVETARLAASRADESFRAAVAAHCARVAPLADIESAVIRIRIAGGAVVVDAGARLR